MCFERAHERYVFRAELRYGFIAVDAEAELVGRLLVEPGAQSFLHGPPLRFASSGAVLRIFSQFIETEKWKI